MKLNEVLQKTIQFFKDKQFDSPRLDAELIIAHGLGLDRVQLYLKFDQPLGEIELEKLRALVKRRTQGEPVAYILGYKDFFGYRFAVNSNTLIPRPETEELVEHVNNWLKKNGLSAPQLIDLGAGTGCVGLSVLKSFEQAMLWSADISLEALTVAKLNAENLNLTERVRFVVGDAVESFAQAPMADVVMANPPYIAQNDPEVESGVKLFEPHLALFAQEEGEKFLRDWSKLYVEKLKQPGLMIMEMGYKQGPSLKDYYQSLGVFKEIRVIKDLSGHDRFIVGEK